MSRLLRSLFVVHLLVLLAGCYWTWGTGLDRVGGDLSIDPAYRSEMKIAADLAAFPENSRCLLVSRSLPWEVAFIAAPRILYRYPGELASVDAYVAEKDISCLVVSLGLDEDGVRAVKDVR